jgi:acetoin utilization deacetylase AcuC-like enzyme
MDDALRRIAAFGAEALVLSLGVDTFERDPISFFKLKSEDYLRMGDRLNKTGLPVVVCMEGGYGVPEIGLNVANVLRGIAG